MIDDFADGISEWASETQEWIGESISYEAKALFTNIVNFSPRAGIAPYSTGHFVHNWTISPMTPEYSEKVGEETSFQKIAEINAKLNSDYFFLYPKVFFTNATSYAGQVEQDGWVRTGPYSPLQKAFSGGGDPVTKAFAQAL